MTADDPTGWFERLYAAAAVGAADVPWERGGPHPLLDAWARGRDGAGRRALVVGAGLGHDAELLAGLGFDTLAFDVSPTAVRSARARFPGSRVRYLTADLLDPPVQWIGAFDLVAEVFTVQSLPEPHRGRAIANVARMVAPGGTLVVVAAGREAGEAANGPPWPLTRAEIDAFAAGGLEVVRVEDLRDTPGPGERRWRAELRRGAAGP
ncbi:MAG TPA: class I SAM-dependent methyltransferase [Solirubrobacteraceae bacterium]|nr:class I SAM-dependent methyltransferase [Solirubrobacteraceae bacterium]